MTNSFLSRNLLYGTAILIGLLPAWMILLPLDITGNPTGWQVFVRSNSLAVPLVQMIFVLTVMSGSFSVFKSVNQLPFITKLALSIWLAISCTISFQTGKDPFFSTIGIMKLVIAALFLLALINVRKSSEFRFTLTLWVSIGMGAVLYVLLWVIHILVVIPQGDDWAYRIPGVNNVRHTGHFAFASVVAGLVSFIAFRGRDRALLRTFLPFMFASAGFGLALWTGSRGPLFASLVAVFVTFCGAVGNRKNLAIFFTTSFLATAAVVATLPIPHPEYGIARAIGMGNVSADGERRLTSGRTFVWTQTVDKILERPVFGWGVNQYAILGPSKAERSFHPHNFPLQLMFSGGVVSVILALMIFLPTLWRCKWPNTHGLGAAGTGGAIGILTYSMYDGALYFSYPIMIFLIAIATSLSPFSPEAGQATSI